MGCSTTCCGEKQIVNAWTRVAIARGPMAIVVALYSASALIFLAEQLDTDCDGRVDFGFIALQVSSVISATQVVETVINVIFCPIWGSIADTTSQRKPLFILASMIWVGAIALGGVLLSVDYAERAQGNDPLNPEALFWAFFISLIVLAVFYELAHLLIFAYIPEVVDNENELAAMTARQFAIINGLQIAGAGSVVAVELVLPEDYFFNEMPLVAVAHFFVVVCWFACAVPGLIHLPNRIRSEKAGKAHFFSELKNNLVDIKNNYPTIGFFLASFSLYFAAINSIISILVAYVIGELGYTTSEVGYLGAALLGTAVFGAILTGRMMKKWDLKLMLIIGNSFWATAGFLGPWFVRGRDIDGINETSEYDCVRDEGVIITREATPFSAIMAWVFAVIVGLGVGFIYPLTASIYAMIIPGGKEAGYFGLRTLSSKIIAWAPPLLFTLINEQTQNLQVAFMSLGLWFVLSLPLIMKMDLTQARQDIKHTMEFRTGEGQFALALLEKVDTDEDGKASL